VNKPGEVSLQEIVSLVETAREFLGPMWVKKSMKAAANLPLKGMVNRKQLASIHPLGLIFRELEKTQEAIQKGKPVTNAATLLLLAGLGRNLKSLEAIPGFELLIEQLKVPATYADAALLTEVSAHWLKLGYSPAITCNDSDMLIATANSDQHTYFLQTLSFTFLPGRSIPDDTPLTIPGNFIYSSWWEGWTADAIGGASLSDDEVEAIIDQTDQKADPGTVLYLDLPPYTSKEVFEPILATVATRLQRDTLGLSAVILCLPQYLPHLYVRHTLPVYAEKCSQPLPKSLLNTLSY